MTHPEHLQEVAYSNWFRLLPLNRRTVKLAPYLTGKINYDKVNEVTHDVFMVAKCTDIIHCFLIQIELQNTPRICTITMR